MGYLRRAGHHDFDVLDLRLLVPDSYAPTHSPIGVFGETYVTDIPDLPLVLKILAAHDAGERGTIIGEINPLFTQYCLSEDQPQIPARISGWGPTASLLKSWRTFPAFDLSIPDVSNYATTLIAAAHLKRRRFPPFIVAGGPQVTQSLAARQLGSAWPVRCRCIGRGRGDVAGAGEEFLKGNGSPASRCPAPRSRIVDWQDRRAGTQVACACLLPTPDFSRMPLALLRSTAKIAPPDVTRL